MVRKRRRLLLKSFEEILLSVSRVIDIVPHTATVDINKPLRESPGFSHGEESGHMIRLSSP